MNPKSEKLDNKFKAFENHANSELQEQLNKQDSKAAFYQGLVSFLEECLQEMQENRNNTEKLTEINNKIYQHLDSEFKEKSNDEVFSKNFHESQLNAINVYEPSTSITNLENNIKDSIRQYNREQVNYNKKLSQDKKSVKGKMKLQSEEIGIQTDEDLVKKELQQQIKDLNKILEDKNKAVLDSAAQVVYLKLQLLDQGKNDESLYEARIAELENENTNLQNQTKEIEHYKNTLKDLNEYLNNKEMSEIQQEKNMTKLTEKLNDMQDKVEALVSKNNQLENELSNEVMSYNAEITSLNKQLESKSNEIEEITSQKIQKEQLIEQMQQEIDQLTSKLEDTQNLSTKEHEEIDQKLQEKEQLLKNKTKEINELTDELNTNEIIIKALNDRADEIYEKAKEDASELFNKSQTTIDSLLEGRDTALHQMLDERGDLLKELQDNMIRIGAQQQLNTQLQNQLSIKQGEAKNQFEALQKSNQDKQKLDNDLREAKKKNVSQSQEIEEYKQQLTELTENLDKKTEEQQEEIQKLTALVEKTQNEQNTVQKELHQLQEQIEAQNSDNRNLTQQYHRTLEEKQKLQQRSKESANLHGKQVTSLEQQIQVLQKDLSNEREDSQALEKTRLDLKTKLTNTQKELQEVKQAVQLQDMISQSKNENLLQKSKQEASNLQRFYEKEHQATLDDEGERWDLMMNNFQEGVAKLEAQAVNTESQKELSAVRKNLSAATSRIEERNTKIDQLNNQLDEHKQSIQETTENMKNVQSELSLTTSQLNLANQGKEKLENKLSFLQIINSKQSKLSQVLEQQNMGMNEDLSKMSNALKKKDELLSDMEQKLDDADKTLSKVKLSSQETLKNVQNQLQILQEQNTLLQDDIAEKQTKITQEGKINKAIQNKNQELSDENKKLQHQLTTSQIKTEVVENNVTTLSNIVEELELKSNKLLEEKSSMQEELNQITNEHQILSEKYKAEHDQLRLANIESQNRQDRVDILYQELDQNKVIIATNKDQLKNQKQELQELKSKGLENQEQFEELQLAHNLVLENNNLLTKQNKKIEQKLVDKKNENDQWKSNYAQLEQILQDTANQVNNTSAKLESLKTQYDNDAELAKANFMLKQNELERERDLVTLKNKELSQKQEEFENVQAKYLAVQSILKDNFRTLDIQLNQKEELEKQLQFKNSEVKDMHKEYDKLQNQWRKISDQHIENELNMNERYAEEMQQMQDHIQNTKNELKKANDEKYQLEEMTNHDKEVLKVKNEKIQHLNNLVIKMNEFQQDLSEAQKKSQDQYHSDQKKLREQLLAKDKRIDKLQQQLADSQKEKTELVAQQNNQSVEYSKKIAELSAQYGDDRMQLRQELSDARSMQQQMSLENQVRQQKLHSTHERNIELSESARIHDQELKLLAQALEDEKQLNQLLQKQLTKAHTDSNEVYNTILSQKKLLDKKEENVQISYLSDVSTLNNALKEATWLNQLNIIQHQQTKGNDMSKKPTSNQKKSAQQEVYQNLYSNISSGATAYKDSNKEEFTKAKDEYNKLLQGLDTESKSSFEYAVAKYIVSEQSDSKFTLSIAEWMDTEQYKTLIIEKQDSNELQSIYGDKTSNIQNTLEDIQKFSTVDSKDIEVDEESLGIKEMHEQNASKNTQNIYDLPDSSHHEPTVEDYEKAAKNKKSSAVPAQDSLVTISKKQGKQLAQDSIITQKSMEEEDEDKLLKAYRNLNKVNNDLIPQDAEQRSAALLDKDFMSKNVSKATTKSYQHITEVIQEVGAETKPLNWGKDPQGKEQLDLGHGFKPLSDVSEKQEFRTGNGVELKNYRAVDVPTEIDAVGETQVLSLVVRDVNGNNISQEKLDKHPELGKVELVYKKDGKLGEIVCPKPVFESDSKDPKAPMYTIIDGEVYTLPINKGQYDELNQSLDKGAQHIDMTLDKTKSIEIEVEAGLPKHVREEAKEIGKKFKKTVSLDREQQSTVSSPHVTPNAPVKESGKIKD